MGSFFFPQDIGCFENINIVYWQVTSEESLLSPCLIKDKALNSIKIGGSSILIKRFLCKKIEDNLFPLVSVL